MQLYTEHFGVGERLVVLIHGLGATGAVWRRVAPLLVSRGFRVMIPDLRGHGRSPRQGPWGAGIHAADIAEAIADEEPANTILFGHSFGGVVAALVGSGLFGPVPARVIALGVKTDWDDAEIAATRALAEKPPRLFATPEEAEARYLKVAGLEGLVAPGGPETAGGIRSEGGGWTLSADPKVYLCVGPDVPAVLRLCRAPLRLAAGSADPMASPTTMRVIDPGAIFLPGSPHSAQLADPEAVAALVE